MNEIRLKVSRERLAFKFAVELGVNEVSTENEPNNYNAVNGYAADHKCSCNVTLKKSTTAIIVARFQIIIITLVARCKLNSYYLFHILSH